MIHGENSPVIVGEVNPLSVDDRCSLYPRPRGSSGHRLMLIMGLRARTYLALRRVNLCRGSWSRDEARRRAVDLLPGQHGLVVLGRKCARAFGLSGEAFSCERLSADRVAVLLPHPSGLCRVWNDPDSVAAARELLVRHFPGVPWGEVDEE